MSVVGSRALRRAGSHDSRGAGRGVGARRRILAVVVATTLTAIGLTAWASAPASASVLPGAITGVTVTPAQPNINSPITVHLTWCVPDGTKSGDTFSLTLPRQLSAPQGFLITDTTGATVATASIASGPPVVVTFTMSAYAASHQDVCGTAFFTSYLNNSDYAGTTQQLTFSTGGTQFVSTITVPSSPAVDRSHAHKLGSFTQADQCRTVATDCITWTIQTPIGPATGGTVTDTVAAPQTIDRASVHVLIGDDSGVGAGFAHGQPYTGPTTITLTGSTLSITFGAVPANRLLAVVFEVSLPQPSTAGGISYGNTGARVNTRFPDGSQVTDTVSAFIRSAAAGGTGSGVTPVPAVSIIKDDANGNAADTPATAVSLPDGTVGLVYTIKNTGAEPLIDVVVSDDVVSNGQVSDLHCDFPTDPAGTTDTSWPGPLAVGASFTCTATLSGVAAGATLHEDIGSVHAVGQVSGVPVSDQNPYYASRPAVSVGDYVWSDSNDNGLQDSDEAGIPGVRLTLTGPTGQPVTDTAGQPVGPTTTDSTGHYLFSNLPVLPAGQHYTVTVDNSSPALAGYVPTKAEVGTDRSIDSSTGSATSGDLTANGDSDLTLDFGFVQPVSVGDWVWLDANHNGIQDTGEKGIPGVTLTITTVGGQPVTDLSGQPVGPTTTDSTGHYVFTDLPPGQYVVHLDAASVPAIYAPTLTGQGTPATDSSTGSAQSAVLAAGQQDVTLDFGFWEDSGVAAASATRQPSSSVTPPADSPTPAALASTGADPAGLIGAAALLLLSGGLALGLAGWSGSRRRPAGRAH